MFNFRKKPKQPIQPIQRSRIVLPSKIYSIVPFHLFQTWKTLDLPPHMKKTVDLLKQQNPEFTHFLYDDEMCRDFIKSNFPEDVLYAFDKLVPGAFKADLWRCCILYKKGGIYLDIKYSCVNNFLLRYLTDDNYYVRDLCHTDITGIYNALLVSHPNNPILYSCIQKIIHHVHHNDYRISSLDVTGPHMMTAFLNTYEIQKLPLSFDGDHIHLNGTPILTMYNEYRREQSSIQTHYGMLWDNKEIYHYPTLTATRTTTYASTIVKRILGTDVKLHAGTPTIIEYKGSYLINLRWVNYTYKKNGQKTYCPDQWISLNSRFMVDQHGNKLTEDVFLEEDFQKEKDYAGIGLEDLRIFNYKERYYYLATYFDPERKIISVSSYVYSMGPTYQLKRNLILPSMYDLKHKIIEKNWSFVSYQHDLCVVYKWYPLQIGKINYDTNQLTIMDINYQVPECFSDARGTTCGYEYNDEIWFVLHKAQCSPDKKYNYQHFIAIFDTNMKLIRYSELFKLGGCKVEFCIGLIVKEDSIILSYSLLDCTPCISTYNKKDLFTSIRWFQTP